MTATTGETYLLPSIGQMVLDMLCAIVIVAFWLLMAVSLAIAVFAGAVYVAFL